MKIAKVEVFPVALPLRNPFSIASGTMTHTLHAVVLIATDDGIIGYGEAATWHVVTGYDQHELIWVIERYLGPAIIGMDPFDIEAIMMKMDHVLPKNLMAKAGIEMACQDLCGKTLGVSLSRLLGGSLTNSVEVIQVVDIVPPEDAVRNAAGFVEEGYRCIKIKIGLNPKEDIERVRVVRETVGPDIRLRVDGNQGYDRSSAMKVCKALEPFDLQWIEQPLPDWDLEGLALLGHTISTPIAVDESICGIHDVYRIARIGAADVINIKLSKCGGITNSLKIAHAAQSMGLSCFLGGCLESGLGTAAALHFAASCPNLCAGAELPGSVIFTDDIIAEPFIPDRGIITPPTGPGIGVEVRLDKMKQYARPS